MKYYVSKTIRLTTYLHEVEKFDIIKEQPDRNNEKYNVWLFEDNINLRMALERYKNRNKQ